MFTPGAETSGFSRNESGVGPAPEKEAICRRLVVAPTVIAAAAEPGEDSEPRPNPSKSFPAATTGTTPALAAPSSARTTRSRLGAISGSPIERFTTSMPSRTAASIPAAISGEFPSRPTLDAVGTVRTR
jgi:hypothetical protein